MTQKVNYPKSRTLEGSNVSLRRKSAVNLALLLAILIGAYPSTVRGASPALSIYGKVTDAETGLPISGATVLIWDLNTLDKPRWGAGIYLTDERGEYNVSGPYVKAGHTYLIYAYRGNFTKKVGDYIPAVKRLKFESSIDVSFSLVPGALIELEGRPYLVQSSSPGAGRMFIRVLSETGLNASFIDEYGDSVDTWFIGLDRNLAIVPANTPVTLEAHVWFFSVERRRIEKEVFHLYNGSSPFLLSQGDKTSSQISSYSLRGGMRYVESTFVDISSQLDQAQSVGFVVFEERRRLASQDDPSSVNQKMIKASSILTRAQNDRDYLEVWTLLREALATMDLISMSLQNMRLVSKTSAVYLSAIMATFSAVLAFFLFEDSRRKLYSSIAIYAIFLVSLYLSYPGAHIIIDENAFLFLQSAAISLSAVLAVVFGIPRLWKEREIEGEVSWRSATSIIFSMGKRQIRRKRIRGTFTILSVIILVLAFTSLTSFGTVFGIVSEELTTTPPSDGVMVKRVMNETSLLFSPLGSDDPETLSKILGVENIAQRYENIPSSSPAARLVNPESGNSWFVYGILGVSPQNESIYTRLDESVEGRYLSEARYDEILVSRSVASSLGVEAGENVTLQVLGTQVSSVFTIAGVIDDEEYMGLMDLDGVPFGPSRLLEDGSVRRCNSTEVVVMNWKAAESLQRTIDAQQPEGAPRFAVLSDIVFQPRADVTIDSLARTLIFVFSYDVFVSSKGRITYYHMGSYVELKGAAELLIPLVMVGLNVGMVMMNSVYERRKEIRTLSMLGLNPTHIGLIFVAEAVILGMVGGSLGYLFGLGFYRIMVVFGQELMVREKLEWWWSAIGFAIALAASVLSSIRPAALAVSTYTPSKVRRIKMPEKKARVRKEELFKAYQARQLSMPVKVPLSEKIFFLGFFLDRLDDLKTGFIERVENVEDVPEIEKVRGELVKEIKFEYRYEVSGRERKTKNSLVMTKSPQENYYRVRLVTEPAVPGMPEDTIERTIDFVNDICLYWVKNKKRLIGA